MRRQLRYGLVTFLSGGRKVSITVPLMSVANWLACLVLGLAGGMLSWIAVRVLKWFDGSL
jgi:hypothetical protein